MNRRHFLSLLGAGSGLLLAPKSYFFAPTGGWRLPSSGVAFNITSPNGIAFDMVGYPEYYKVWNHNGTYLGVYARTPDGLFLLAADIGIGLPIRPAKADALIGSIKQL